MILCLKRLHRQDRRFARFFRSDPGWVLNGRRLTLTSGDTVIELRRKRLPRDVPTS